MRYFFLDFHLIRVYSDRPRASFFDHESHVMDCLILPLDPVEFNSQSEKELRVIQ